MTQHLPTRAQATRGLGVAFGIAAILFLMTAMSRTDDGDPHTPSRSFGARGSPVVD
jgi:hypothetical protein